MQQYIVDLMMILTIIYCPIRVCEYVQNRVGVGEWGGEGVFECSPFIVSMCLITAV